MRITSEPRTLRETLLWRALPLLALLPLLVTGCSGGGGGKGSPPPVTVFDPNPLTASGRAGSVFVREAWIPPPAARVYRTGSGVVVNLTLENLSRSAWDSVVSGSTPVASRVALTQYSLGQDFISVPDERERVNAAAQLFDISRPLVPGERVPITLRLRSGSSLTLQVPVRS